MKGRAFVSLVVIGALAGLLYAWSTSPLPDFILVLVFAVLGLLVEWFAIGIPSGGSASLSVSIVYASILLGGPLAAALASLPLAVSRQDIRERKPPLRIAFNVSQIILTALVPGWVFLGLGGTPLLQLTSGSPSVLGWFLPALVVIPVQAGVNIALVASVMLLHGAPWRGIWMDGMRPYLAGMVAPFLLGLVFAQLVAVGGYWSMTLLVAPFLVAKQTFRVYQDQADAYRDTLRSLINALEAKDTYTRGHSERVARYARGIAQVMGLGEAEVKEIEQAALLHDIGKIAISTSILRKPAALSASEYELIQGHPGLAAETLADIEFLEGIVPMISSHHERIDGKGYPQGLQGDEINLGARILAVGDCFDAMTSDRPYRQALQQREAISHLFASAGTQLDCECVRAFVQWGQLAQVIDPSAVDA